SPPHLGLHLGDEGILAQKQAGPHPLLLRPVIAFGWVRFRGLGKQTLDHRLGCPDIRFLGKHRTHGGHAFLVSLFSPSESDFAFPPADLTIGTPLPSTEAIKSGPLSGASRRLRSL